MAGVAWVQNCFALGKKGNTLQIYCELEPVEIYNSVHELIRMAFPSAEIVRERESAETAEISLKISAIARGDRLKVGGEITSAKQSNSLQEEYSLEDYGEEKSNQARRFIRIFTYRLLSQNLKREINPYGILTGVRPVKLVHRMLDEGMDIRRVAEELRQDYLVSPAKAELLLEIAQNNRPFLPKAAAAAKKLSVYIGIPFCPSRCYYCSFTAAELKSYQGDVVPFLNSLFREMNIVGDILQDRGISVQCIYIGGGTPTVLSSQDLEKVLDILQQKFISNASEEITVEAGRPDSVSLQKLKMMQEAGVSRVCINPQTMNDATLIRIGRKHDAKGVVQSVEWAREAGIKKINMDLIVGLPGEGIRENTHTAEEILKLKPENITLHSLALKRGSPMALSEGRQSIEQRVTEVESSIERLSSMFREAGYLPYYMYRQKYMKAGMENTGFAQANNFCLYNIQVIEERQSIIGLGGAAASKFVNPDNWTLTSIYNPKNPPTYIESLERLIRRKVDKLQALN